MSDDVSHLLANAIAHAHAGNHQAALHAASEACHAAPHLPQPHYAYGEAWLALNEPARAEQAFAAAIQRSPAWPDAWINYGLARYRQGAIEDAKTAMRRALRHAPSHPAAMANLGAFLRISGGGEEAEGLLRAALKQAPDSIGARLNLAADLLQEERPADALALLDAAPALPTELRALRHWRLQHALALLQLRRPAEARKDLLALSALGPIPPEIAPLWHWRLVLLALAENNPPAARLAAGQMAASLAQMGPAAVLEHQIMAHYDLAKFWSGQGEHRVAFAHWRQGHALLKPSQPFSRADYKALIDANIAAFPRASSFQPRYRLRGAPAEPPDPTPVFIVGMPRSGTTLCEQIIAAHSQAYGAGERGALGRAFAQLGGTDPAAAPHRVARQQDAGGGARRLSRRA